MAPVPAYARHPSALDMALLLSHGGHSSIIEIETALEVLDRDGDPKNPEHRLAYFALRRRWGRVYGHRPLPAKWEAP